MKYNRIYMNRAIKEAKKAYLNDEVPVGAVIVKNNKIIACGYNKKEKNNNAISHAEIIAIIKASKKLNNWRLNDCDIYVTLMPCPMCASAIKQARISNIYCGLNNSDEDVTKIVDKILDNDNTNGKTNIVSDLAVDEVKNIMQKFFKNKRIDGNNVI